MRSSFIPVHSSASIDLTQVTQPPVCKATMAAKLTGGDARFFKSGDFIVCVPDGAREPVLLTPRGPRVFSNDQVQVSWKSLPANPDSSVPAIAVNLLRAPRTVGAALFAGQSPLGTINRRIIGPFELLGKEAAQDLQASLVAFAEPFQNSQPYLQEQVRKNRPACLETLFCPDDLKLPKNYEEALKNLAASAHPEAVAFLLDELQRAKRATYKIKILRLLTYVSDQAWQDYCEAHKLTKTDLKKRLEICCRLGFKSWAVSFGTGNAMFVDNLAGFLRYFTQNSLGGFLD
ncbi:MAG: hypothetical protein H7A33_02360 [Deltaproteobacteria bacterium]|nr:hypothetical protein [Deltaproteobacteria bacterium]